MGFSSILCNQTQPRLDFSPGGRLSIEQLSRSWRKKDKVVFVMGATGTGKSKLSVDLAARFPAEIVNSDKIQVFRGLDIVTNKISDEEQCGVPHHLIGFADPESEFSAADYCEAAVTTVQSIIARDKVPIIVGGSNSYIETLVDGPESRFGSRFDCCFLWVDVSLPVLHQFVSDRVDKMVEMGMVEEAEKMFDPTGDYDRGIRRAIGVPEFDAYFRSKTTSDHETQTKFLREAIRAVKENTCQLACRQLEKIYRLRNAKGWKIHRLDATDAFRRRGREAEEAWSETVEGPGARIVGKFLYDMSLPSVTDQVATGTMGIRVPTTTIGATALATATH